MKWKYETWSAYSDRVTAWHSWFAWHPVWADNGTAYWLCKVERRMEFCLFVGRRIYYRELNKDKGEVG